MFLNPSDNSDIEFIAVAQLWSSVPPVILPRTAGGNSATIKDAGPPKRRAGSQGEDLYEELIMLKRESEFIWNSEEEETEGDEDEDVNADDNDNDDKVYCGSSKYIVPIKNCPPDCVICMCNVLLTLYLYLYHSTLCCVPCALCAGPMYQPLPCPCVPTSVHDLHAYSVR